MSENEAAPLFPGCTGLNRSVHEMLPDLPRIRSGLSKEIDTFESWRAAVTSTKACGLPPRLSRRISQLIAKEISVEYFRASSVGDSLSESGATISGQINLKHVVG